MIASTSECIEVARHDEIVLHYARRKVQSSARIPVGMHTEALAPPKPAGINSTNWTWFGSRQTSVPPQADLSGPRAHRSHDRSIAPRKTKDDSYSVPGELPGLGVRRRETTRIALRETRRVASYRAVFRCVRAVCYVLAAKTRRHRWRKLFRSGY